MNGFQRVKKFLFGLLMLGVGLFLFFFPSDEAYMFIIAILSLKRLGEETYVTIINEKYLAKKAKKEQSEKSH